jgi:hypothetical protein
VAGGEGCGASENRSCTATDCLSRMVQRLQEKGAENVEDDSGILKSCVSKVLSGSSLEHSHIEKDSGVDSRVVRDTSKILV